MKKVFLVIESEHIGFSTENPDTQKPKLISFEEATPYQRKNCDRLIYDTKKDSIIKKITAEELNELDKGLFNEKHTFEYYTTLLRGR